MIYYLLEYEAVYNDVRHFASRRISLSSCLGLSYISCIPTIFQKKNEKILENCLYVMINRIKSVKLTSFFSFCSMYFNALSCALTRLIVSIPII